jgi:cytochrome d ubiquinol oxidase subunit II
METLWFWLVAFLIAGYVVLDGFDIGAGIVHLLVGRTGEERRQVLETIGPFWDGNEVWLLAGGGTLFLAFPALYAASFSGFYLPLTVVLWLLMLRGLSIELRNHVETVVWKQFWDAAFCCSSLLLAVFYGAALGNVVRGVPLDAQGEFFLPLWTHFGVSGEVGILDWYTVLAGVTALCALTVHGALWVAWKTPDPVMARAREAASATWAILVLLTGLLTLCTFQVQPLVPAGFAARRWQYLVPLLPLAGLAGVWLYARNPNRLGMAFVSSCLYLAGMLASVAAGLYPYVLPAIGHPAGGLTIHNASTGAHGLRAGLAWWIPGMALAAAYMWFLYRRFRGKVGAHRET